MRRLWLAVLTTLALAAVTALAADFWETKKFTEWSEKEVQRILRNSPWARPVEIRLEGMGGGGSMGGGRSGRGGRGGGGGMPSAASSGGMDSEGGMGGGGGRGGGGMEAPQGAPTLTAIIRWHSALPLKQAVARVRYGDEAGSSPEAAQNLTRQETHYVVGIIGLPPTVLRGGNPATLKSGALLKIKDHPPIEAEAVQPDRAERGVNLYIFFPKTQPGSHVITLEDKEVEVELKAGSTNIRRKFKLKDMVFDGKLEI